MTDSRPTKKLPRIKSTTYSVTMRRESMVNVAIDAEDVVTVTVADQSMTMSKNAARKLVAALLEKLG